MKFCYIDESGKGDEKVLVLAGVVADAYRMHVTKTDWNNLLVALSEHLKRPVEEFHSREFYRGNGVWRDLNAEERTLVINYILDWLIERQHKVIFSAIDKQAANDIDWTSHPELMTAKGKPNHWMLSALHLMLSIQKMHQGETKNKGNTIMVFDRGVSEHDVAALSLAPPEWSDTFYKYRRKSRKKNPPPPLNQIIDVPYFADSKHVGLLQVADLFAYLLRHHAELQAGYSKPKYVDEIEKIDGWVKQIGTLMTNDASRWPATGGCACSNLYRSIAPASLLTISRDSRS